jgi:hypothetical protein
LIIVLSTLFQFATGWWFFIDAVIFAKTHQPELPVEIKFEDWVPGLLGTMSLIMCVEETELASGEDGRDDDVGMDPRPPRVRVLLIERSSKTSYAPRALYAKRPSSAARDVLIRAKRENFLRATSGLSLRAELSRRENFLG